MHRIAISLFTGYLILLGARSSDLLFGLEVTLDVLAIACAWHAGQRVVAGAFAATLISTTNFQVLSRVYGVKLTETIGTWLEIEINVPYIACYALAAFALYRWARDDRRQRSAGLILSLVALGVTLAAYLPALGRAGYPAQHRVLHVLCFAVSAFIYGYGAVSLAALDTPGRPLVALGFVSLALSGFFFQTTEIYPGAYALDAEMELTWTLGQFAAIFGLIKQEP